MQWKLLKESEDKKQRTYYNDKTNTECKTQLIYTDKLDNEWYGFYDLFQIPAIRIMQAKAISDLFTMGLTPEDIKRWIKDEKELLRSNDPEKYEKLYKLVLEKEQTISTVVDPLKQHLALCTIYVLTPDERIDYYTTEIGAHKLEQWSLDPDAQAFFLNWHAGHIQSFMKDYKNITEIALNSKELLKLTK